MQKSFECLHKFNYEYDYYSCLSPQILGASLPSLLTQGEARQVLSTSCFRRQRGGEWGGYTLSAAD